jgi:uncharacterized membrane protein (Fun14 family)
MSIIKSFVPSAATMGCGFIVGILIGYALKKVIKIATVIIGLFLAGLAYLQYHQMVNINWNKLQTVSEGAITTLSNAITRYSTSLCISSRVGALSLAASLPCGKPRLILFQFKIRLFISQNNLVAL